MEKPDVDRIEGIAPAIAIRQKNSIRNPRSTVGTTTEIHDYMRLLFARAGRTSCRRCGREVIRETAEVVARQLGALTPGTRLLLGFDLAVAETAPLASADAAPEVDELSEETTDETSSPPGSAGTHGLFELGALRRPADAAGPDAAAIAGAIETLRRKGFGRLLVDDRVVGF